MTLTAEQDYEFSDDVIEIKYQEEAYAIVCPTVANALSQIVVPSIFDSLTQGAGPTDRISNRIHINRIRGCFYFTNNPNLATQPSDGGLLKIALVLDRFANGNAVPPTIGDIYYSPGNNLAFSMFEMANAERFKVLKEWNVDIRSGGLNSSTTETQAVPVTGVAVPAINGTATINMAGTPTGVPWTVGTIPLFPATYGTAAYGTTTGAYNIVNTNGFFTNSFQKIINFDFEADMYIYFNDVGVGVASVNTNNILICAGGNSTCETVGIGAAIGYNFTDF